MSLLEEIQKDAVDSRSDLGTLLRKYKVFAVHLKSQVLEDWLIWESNGYSDKVDVPNYRIWSLEVKGNFWPIWFRNRKCPNSYSLSAREGKAKIPEL